MKTDKKAPPMAPDKLLAKCILKASEIREQSFDHAAANASSIQADKDRSKNSNNVYSGITDFRRFYRKTIAESCEEACSNTGLSAILHILLDNSWNESINWAKDTLA